MKILSRYGKDQKKESLHKYIKPFIENSEEKVHFFYQDVTQTKTKVRERKWIARKVSQKSKAKPTETILKNVKLNFFQV